MNYSSKAKSSNIRDFLVAKCTYGTAVVPFVPRVPGEERIGVEDRVYTHITYAKFSRSAYL